MTQNGEAESTENLGRVIQGLRALSGDIDSCAVLSSEGELIYSSSGSQGDRERTSAMLVALANLAERIAVESGKDQADQVRVKTETGYLLMVRMEKGGTLVASTGPEARVGLALYDMRNSRSEVEKAITEETA